MSKSPAEMTRTLEGVPPHDETAERCVLGSMLIEPYAAEVAAESLTPEHFYKPIHRLAFNIIAGLVQQGRCADDVILAAELAKAAVPQHDIDALTKRAILDTPNAGSIAEYIAIVDDRLQDRKALEYAAHVLNSAQRGEGRRILDSLGLRSDRHDECQPLSPSSLLQYDTKNDENCLIGRRWICRGGSLTIIGQSGLGKSAAAMQFVVAMALNESFFGIRPVRPLKVVIIQAENDTGDLAEEIKGVTAGMGIANRTNELDERLVFLNQANKTGDEFTMWLRGVVKRHQPDLVVIDPLLSYLGGDISDQKTCSRFLRNQLNPISQQYGCAWVIIHHTGKPPRDPAQRNGHIGQDYSYLGIGSSELTNWTRAVLTLREVEEGLYELRAAKRGKRSGLTASDDPHAPTSEVCYIQHAERGICWVRADHNPGEKKLVENLRQVQLTLQAMGAGGLAYGKVLEIVMRVFNCKTTKAKEILKTLIQPLCHQRLDGLYYPNISNRSQVADPVPTRDQVAGRASYKDATRDRDLGRTRSLAEFAALEAAGE